MANGTINKAILIGNLGSDPEIRRLENGTVVANFSIATTEVFMDRNTNERRTTTDWHNIVVWRGLAEMTEKHLKKGMKVYVEGKLKTRSYNDKEGNTRYTTEIVAEDMNILNWNDNQDRQNNMNANKSSNDTSEQKPKYPTENNQSNPLDDISNNFGSNFEDDDLPF